MAKSNNKGSALLMALFISAIAAIICMSLLDRQSIDIERASLTLNSNQAYLYAQGAEVWADHYLLGDIYPQDNNNKSQFPWTNWPKVMPMQYLPNGGNVSAVLMDAQSLFNLNNLTDENQQTAFINFLQIILPSAYSQNAPAIVKAIIDWILPQGQNSNITLEEYYLNHHPPYQVAHQLFTTVGELRLVNGINQQIYNILSPYVIALPEKTPININTASAALLTTLSNKLSLEQAQQIIVKRNSNNGYANTNDFTSNPDVQKLAITGDNITTTSNYFLLRVDVKFNNVNMTIFCLYKRILDQNKKIQVNKLWESIGTV